MDYEIRKDAFALGNMKMDVRGTMLNVGDSAPDFELIHTSFKAKTLEDYAGKIKVLSIVPSLDTSVCDAQTRRFNEEASALSEDIVILTISADLPFAQRRWCGAAGVDRVDCLSTHKDMQFSDDYGVHVLSQRYNQRAVLVLDKDNTVAYTQYVYNIGDEPDYATALDAARALL